MNGAIYYENNILFSHVKISSFRAKAHLVFHWRLKNKLFYYINTNEISGELSRENLISSHVKITCYLHMLKYHFCDGYIINRAFHTKKLSKGNGFIGVYIIKRHYMAA